ncbi:hypothetical protein BKH20_05945 [Actinomyces oris]|uniref:Uncharacterized protein n=1 Tax=Actinomyces oris TaxID=544580 RepID=A0A1Q8WR24_9ACTO|nr:hypothetical protein [Actinomyces oris]OLO70402.1 hypothetical protein BKH20_05945 [Actinomyces oris]
MSGNESRTDVGEESPVTADSAHRPAPRPPVPSPPRADVALTAAQGLHDHADELAQIAQMPLEERAAALAAIHEDLAAVLHKAEG